MIRRCFSLLFVAGLLSTAMAFAQGDYKAEVAPGPPSGDVAKAVEDALQPSGVKLTDSQGKTVAEIWLRKSVPASANPNSSSDVLYGVVAPGTLVGVLQVSDQWSDFRGQTIKAGYYTLRYELVPQDGNHMGVSTYRDFLLLVPAAKDPGPDQLPGFNDVVKLSRLSTGTGHPGVMVMDPVSQSVTKFPAAFQDDLQDWAVQAKTSLGGKDLPIAFVLVGKYEG